MKKIRFVEIGSAVVVAASGMYLYSVMTATRRNDQASFSAQRNAMKSHPVRNADLSNTFPPQPNFADMQDQMAKELSLTPLQREKLKSIFSDMDAPGSANADPSKMMGKMQDHMKRLFEILTPEQRKKLPAGGPGGMGGPPPEMLMNGGKP